MALFNSLTGRIMKNKIFNTPDKMDVYFKWQMKLFSDIDGEFLLHFCHLRKYTISGHS